MMMYKEKGVGLQTYSLFQKGYIYQIFMCNNHSPKQCLAKRMLPLHAIVMSLFDTL